MPRVTQLLALLLLIPLSLASVLEQSSSCRKACDELRTALSSTSVTALQPLNFYWAQQQSALRAACYASPASAEEVSTVLLTAKRHKCQFAIRGGGHSDVPGASNIEGGLVLSLGRLKDVTPDLNAKAARIGAGCTWGNVYNTLDAYNMTTTGGREESVGVAGLILGGGLSYFSGTHGYVCDTVQSFQAVLANGSIVEVSKRAETQDLFKALKGGGNNFAVVTRFDVDMFPYDGIYGGLSIWPDSPQVAKELTQAFVDVVNNAPTAPHANIFSSVSYTGLDFVRVAGLSYTLPDPKPAIFKPFYTSTLQSRQLVSTQRVTTHSNLAAELDRTQPPNFRNQFTTATFANDVNLHRRMVEIFKEEVIRAVPKMSTLVGFAPGLSFQPLTKNMLSLQAAQGGNVLGTDVSEAPLVVVGFLWQWSSFLDDAVVLQGIQNVLDRSSAVARESGLLNEFIYQNYAAPKQRPLASYGAQNRAFLQRVSKKYDPEGIFQTLVPGGFKIM